MTDIRETENYETILQEGLDALRETQAYQNLLGNGLSADVRETQAYQFVLGSSPNADMRDTESYQTAAQEGVDELRDSLTYFWMLGEVSIEAVCGLLSFIAPGPNALSAPMGSEPLALTSSFGPKGIFQ